MAAEQGNQYWKLAKETLGRRRLIKTAKEFQKKFLEYLEWAEKNPIQAKRASKRESFDDDKTKRTNQVYMESVSRRRPLSMYGLCLFLGVSRKWFEMTLKNLESKGERTDEEEDLFTILTRAKDFIEMQQFDGACIGDFNANIITRILGLQDRTDITTNGNPIESTPMSINIIRDERMLGEAVEDV